MDDVATIESVARPFGESIKISEDGQISIMHKPVIRTNIEQLVRTAVLAEGKEKAVAQWLIRECAL